MLVSGIYDNGVVELSIRILAWPVPVTKVGYVIKPELVACVVTVSAFPFKSPIKVVAVTEETAVISLLFILILVEPAVLPTCNTCDKDGVPVLEILHIRADEPTVPGALPVHTNV